MLAKPGYEIQKCKELRERSVGDFSGKSKEDLLVNPDYKKYVMDDNFNKFRTSFIQKAPNGESYTDVSNRCKEFLNSLDFSKNITIGIFSHKHAIRCLLLNMLNITPKENVFDMEIENCVPYVVEGNDISNLKLISHNLDELIKK